MNKFFVLGLGLPSDDDDEPIEYLPEAEIEAETQIGAIRRYIKAHKNAGWVSANDLNGNSDSRREWKSKDW